MFDVADAKIGDAVAERRADPRHPRVAEASPGASTSTSPSSRYPADSAQHVLDLVVAAGVKAVLNFSPGALKVPPGVKLKSVDLTVSLESLSFYLAQGRGCGLKHGSVGSREARAPRLSHVGRETARRADGGRRRQGRHRARGGGARARSRCRREARRLIRSRRGEEGRSAAGGAARRHHGREADERAHPAVPSAAAVARRRRPHADAHAATTSRRACARAARPASRWRR